MSEIISISIIELMEKTERWLLDHDYKKSTIGVYKATWNKFRVFSASPFYDRDTAKKFLFRYFGIDENAVVQKCDKRMQQARRHMDVLDEFLRTGQICRRKIRSMTAIDDDIHLTIASFPELAEKLDSAFAGIRPPLRVLFPSPSSPTATAAHHAGNTARCALRPCFDTPTQARHRLCPALWQASR